MKKKISIILFGTSFLISMLGELYLINKPQPHVFSIIGIGIVVILTGYLWLDSIWEYISEDIKGNRLMWDEKQSLKQEQNQETDSRYTELLNILKATYAAVKKNDTKLQEELIDISNKLAQIIEMQNKVIKGQTKALNIAINYSREHANEILEAMKEDNKEAEFEEKNKAELEIKPLYDDPNAALSKDEIAKLFESYGQ